uniref:Galectin domain-containing protein n=1 Tax=Anopheles atroparvus TaxID=41427 RepID=A0A182IKR6_ANOAO
MYPHGVQHLDWNDRLGSTQNGNSNVYFRSQDTDGGSSSSASNDTEYTTLLDETCRKSDRPYDNIAADRDRHNRGSRKNKIFLVVIAFCVIFTLVIGNFPYGTNRGRVGQIAGWGVNTSRQTIDYVLPYENTTLIDPVNVCSTEERAGLADESEKVFLLIVVCSSAGNFEARETIRQTWGNVREFNYDQFRLLHARLRGKYLAPEATIGNQLKDYIWWPTATEGSQAASGGSIEEATSEAESTVSNAAGDDHRSHEPLTAVVDTHQCRPFQDPSKPNSSHSAKTDSSSLAHRNFNIKIVFLVGQSESDYVHQRQQQTPALTGSGERATGGESFAVHQEHQPSTGGLSPEPLFPSGADVDPAFNVVPGATTVDELQLRIVNESEVYGDIIQESFIDSYNNLTLKTIMMLKWVTNNCDGKENVSSKERSIGDKMFLQFQLEQRDYTEDIQARLMVYVHGEDWLKQNVRGAAPLGEVAFVVGKTAKGGAEIGRFQGPVPKGDGRFIEFNVTDLMLQWFKEARDLQADQRTNKYVVLEKFNELARRLVVHIKFLMKCDDDTFVNVPNLVQVLLGGTVPLYKAAISFYDSNTVLVKSTKNRLVEGKHLLTGFMFCEAKPIGDTSSKWYSPTYMYNKEVYPHYLSGTAYVMNFETAKVLYRTSLSTPIFHLEDVYLTGIVAERVKIRRRHHPLFFYSYTKDLCALRGMISQHQLQPTELRNAFDYVTNSSIVCNGPDKRFTVGKLKVQQGKKCQ